MMPLSMFTYRSEHADRVIFIQDTRRFQCQVICLSTVNPKMCHKTEPIRGMLPIQQRSLLINYYSTMLH